MKHYYINGILFLVALLVSNGLKAQELAEVKGVVTSEDGKPLSGVMVYLDGNKANYLTEEDGRYVFSTGAGNHTLSLVATEFINQQWSIELQAGQQIVHDFKLSYDPDMVLDEVEVTGKSIVAQLKETPFNVMAVDAKAVQNTSMDLAQALERSAGVRVRRMGGLGSSASVMINGFRGQQVRVFMDGMPMENFGSAFQMNNIPINLADRIEVYKGVVPIELGADALGGAINIVTKKTNSAYLDASYSYGSFNTHKSNVNLGMTTKSGLQFNINAFQNYSDNTYKVLTTTLEFDEQEDGSVRTYFSDDAYWFKRFHDTYHNETVIAKVGVVQQKWADRMILSATYAQEYKEIQNANIQRFSFGGKHTKSRSVIPSLAYYKNDLGIKNLSLKVMANYSRVKTTNVDTLAGQYNWRGQYYKAPNASKGELDYTYSNFYNNTTSANVNLSYVIKEKHIISLNDVMTSFVRSSIDEKMDEADDLSQSIKKRSTKNVIGLSYNYRISDKLTFTAFDKMYLLNVRGPVRLDDDSYLVTEESYATNGFGALAGYWLRSDLLVKISGEKSVKLPSANQLFGDQVLESSNQSLKPETSRNLNLNFIYHPVFGAQRAHDWTFDAGFVYRDTRDFIRRNISTRDGTAVSVNHGKTRNLGLDFETRYNYKRKWSLGGALTYQNITNREKYDVQGRESLIYKDPMINEPIFYINGDVGYTADHLFKKKNTLSITYFINYMDEYYRGWKSLGADGEQIIIPRQLSHDLRVMYVMNDGRYNLTLEAYNLTDEILYDSYSLQRPGRRYTVTFRFFINKIKN